jgi:hypothetical protein
MKEIAALACCNVNLHNRITRNLERILNEDLLYFNESCDKNLKGYAELEARLHSIASSFRIHKM